MDRRNSGTKEPRNQEKSKQAIKQTREGVVERFCLKAKRLQLQVLNEELEAFVEHRVAGVLVRLGTHLLLAQPGLDVGVCCPVG